MTKRTDNERLLADVLADESATGFNDALLGETLRLARRRRQWRRARRVGGALAVLILITITIRQRARTRVGKPELAQTPPPGFQLVVSRPLSPGQLVATQPLAADSFVTTSRST